MKRTAAICVALVLSLVSSVFAEYSVWNSGKWPKSWPAELEPLRKQARSFENSLESLPPPQHYAIPFTKRDEFESAWPHLLKVKSKGASIVLRRGPSFWLGDKATAGVCVHTPPAGEAPITDGKDAKGNWEKTIYIELIADGEIIDLNRILLPADTPIIDERFKEVPLGIVSRAEAAELRDSHGVLVPRVVRDEEGHVTRLVLNDFKLSPEDVADLGKLEHLRAVVLFRTGFTDGDLEMLTACRKLRHLNLTSTEVTDDAIDSILKFENLESLCVGDVRISPAAMEKLRERNRNQTSGKQLRWGYQQREQ